jgi:hypothetical protein
MHKYLLSYSYNFHLRIILRLGLWSPSKWPWTCTTQTDLKNRALELDNNLQKGLSPIILHGKMWIKTPCKGIDMIYNLYFSGLVRMTHKISKSRHELICHKLTEKLTQCSISITTLDRHNSSSTQRTNACEHSMERWG